MAKEEYKWHKFDHMPTACQQFMAIRTTIQNKQISHSLNIFCFRYRLAKSFIGIDAKEVGRTKFGYEAGMKVSLAYSAYDELTTVASKLGVENFKSKNYNKITNKEMAEKLIKNTKLMKLIRDKTTDKELSNQIELFLKGEDHDILCIARAIRNVFNHGSYTTTSGGVKNKEDAAIYFELADTLLKYCDKTFIRCLKIINPLILQKQII